MGNRPVASPLINGLERLPAAVSRLGDWASKWPYWTFLVGATLVVILKNGFRWAGTTGDGWFIEFRDAIDSWPLKESATDLGSPAWQENYSGIVVFRALTRIGLPYTSATWMLIHILVTAAVLVILGMWVRRAYGDDLGRFVALVILFGAAPMVLMHEIGRYDSFFFLGAVLLATGRRWWTLVLGAMILGTSSWTMSLGLVGALVLMGLVLGSRSLVGRGALGMAGVVFGGGLLMVLRTAQGGDPGLVRLGNLSGGGGSESFNNVIYQAWLNVVQPFPNWIYAIYGVTWILFVLVVLQSSRRRLALAASIIFLPLLAGTINAGDGTREVALTLTAGLLAAAATLEVRSRADGDVQPLRAPSHLVLGLTVIVCLVAPVININPNEPLNPYGWLSDYGLSIVYSILN